MPQSYELSFLCTHLIKSYTSKGKRAYITKLDISDWIEPLCLLLYYSFNLVTCNTFFCKIIIPYTTGSDILVNQNISFVTVSVQKSKSYSYTWKMFWSKNYMA